MVLKVSMETIMPDKNLKSKSSNKPSALDAHIGFWMRFVSNQVSASFEKRLEAKGISVTEWVALRTLFDGELTSHASMIDALCMTKSAASKVLVRLEEKGLIGRGYADESAKTQVLALTKKGEQLVPQLAALADENDDFYFGHLRPEVRENLVNLLRDLVTTHQLKKIPVN
jgi:DNA-binding MarR family transcriptional regulator